MFFRARRIPLAASGAALAALAGAVFAGSNGEPPAARVGGAAPPTVSAPASPAVATGPLVGDAMLRGRLDLARAVPRGEHLQVALGDGRTAELTIDPEIQAAAEAALDKARAPVGAIVVMSVDGRILALAGRRQGDDGGHRDDRLPVTVWAPAASVFKVVTSAALLDAGVDPSKPVCYHDGIRAVVASNLVDDPRRDRRCDDLGFAIARSQNAIIAKLAHRHLDAGKLDGFARAFGFAAAPRFALDAEASRFDAPADPLELARAAAGFWHSELSPLGGALLVNTVASGGFRVTPRLVAALVDADGTRRPVGSVPAERVIDAAVSRQLATLMVGTTERGTAYTGFHGRRGAKLLRFQVGGKTGTLCRHDPSQPYLQYSWFVGFAPAEAPQVSIAVLLGNGELWHIKAHTAARMVLEQAL